MIQTKLRRAPFARARRMQSLTIGATAALAASITTVSPVYAQSAGDSAVVDEIVVTGSRIIRDGYEAPTPVTVVGVETLQQAPTQQISEYMNTLPAFAGTLSTTSGGNEMSGARQSQNNLNLRGLDVFRTLVLLDGHRVVSGDVNSSVNIYDIPQSLISRVDVITGGASAVYGSDAIAGVVNFVLDKNFTGIKSEVQGGITGQGDNESFKVNLTMGTPFAGGRGHIIASAEYAGNNGVYGAVDSRDWGFDTAHILVNPEYNPATGNTSVPQFVVRSQASTLLAAPGGIITSGPLRGVMFGKNGEPQTYEYGPLANSQFNVGGDWYYTDVNRYNQSLANELSRQNAYARVSYDLTDNVNVFFHVIQSSSTGSARSKLDDSLANITINIDNPYLDPVIAARMADLGLTSFTMGSFNLDLPYMGSTNDRDMLTYAAGIEGSFDAFGSTWNWDVFGQIGKTKGDFLAHVRNKNNFNLAVDAVRTADGSIVCRVNADASTANDVPACTPWNPFGWGNNSPEAIDYSKTHGSFLAQRTRQKVATPGITGEPFSNWAGTVSLAAGVEWREEWVRGTPDPLSLLNAYTAGNYKGTNGDYTVTESYLETVVPLAKDVSFARSLDFNGAVRFTDYSTSGSVTTWKAGLTYDPVDDVRIRVTRSRDIRAPNLIELFAAGTAGQSPGFRDPFRNNEVIPTFNSNGIGNLNLKPEEADTTGFGVVYQPSFLPGFSTSVDYYDINIEGAVDTVGTQETLDRCFDGQQVLCANITRDASGQVIGVTTLPVNLSTLHQRGLDVEASYRTQLGSGDLTLRALGTHIYFSKKDDGLNPVQDVAGDNSGTNPLKERWTFTASYALQGLTVTWAGRSLSSGDYGPQYIQCTENCPVSTPTAQTIDYNHIPARFYHDLSFSYDIDAMSTDMQVFLNVRNVLDEQPPMVPNTAYWYMPTNPQLYDTLGRAFFAGVRIRM